MKTRWGRVVLALALLVAAAHVLQTANVLARGETVSLHKPALALVVPLGLALMGAGLARGRPRLVLAGMLVVCVLELGDLAYVYAFSLAVVGLDDPDMRNGFVVSNLLAVLAVAALVACARWAGRPDASRARGFALPLFAMSALALIQPFFFTPHGDLVTPATLVLTPLATAAAMALVALGVAGGRSASLPVSEADLHS